MALSGHGYGHLSQVAPILEALAARVPELRLSLRTPLPEALLRERIAPRFELLPGEVDFGMRMQSALAVDQAASARDYAAFHRDWGQRVADEAAVLTASGATLVLADVPYLSLAAAERAGIEAVALCSLNWISIYGHYCRQRPEAVGILAQMTAAYRSAAVFMQTEPAMPMPELDNTHAIGPVARVPAGRAVDLNQALGLPPATRTLLVGMGGVGLDLPVVDWPRFPGWRLIVPRVANDLHPDVMSMDALNLSFSDLLGGVDALLTKPGYATYVEAACLGLPVLYASRPGWPEEPWLNPWLERHTRATEVSLEALYRGALIAPLEALMAQPPKPRVVPTGVTEAAELIAGRLLQAPGRTWPGIGARSDAGPEARSAGGIGA